LRNYEQGYAEEGEAGDVKGVPTCKTKTKLKIARFCFGQM